MLFPNRPKIETDAEFYKEQFQTPTFVARYMASLVPEGVKTVLEPTPAIVTGKQHIYTF